MLELDCEFEHGLTQAGGSLFSAHEKNFVLALYFCLRRFTSSIARAQDAATQQQIDQVNGRIQDIYDTQDKQDKRIAALEKSIGDLQDKLSQPAANNSASADDLKKLAEQVKDLAKKQQDDNDLIVKELEKLGKGGGAPTTEPQAADRREPTIQPRLPAARKMVTITRFKKRTRFQQSPRPTAPN